MNLRRAKQILDRALEAGTLLSTIGIILAVTIQVTARALLPSAPPCTEEAARMCFLFLVGFSAALAVRDRAFVNIDTVPRWLPRRIAVGLQGSIHVAVAGLMILVAGHAVSFVRLGVDQKSSCLQIPMAYVHGSVLLLAVMVAFYSVLAAVDCFGKLVRREEAR